MTAIIILNWNGADDTLACLDSLASADGNFMVFVVDNGSTDDSLSRISLWIEQNSRVKAVLVPLDCNYGFAKGNNKGLEFAKAYNPDSYLLLNNDTEVNQDFLVRLQEFSAEHPEYRVLTPKINYYYDKHRVWNCGGKLSFGFRKYYYAGCSDTDVKEQDFIRISFVTGCALFFYPELLDGESHLFTERFFFGEEDFDLSLRLLEQGVPMACVLDSLIYHKVGATVGKTLGVSKYYLHYLNRTVDIRLHFGKLKFMVWQFLNMPFALYCFFKSTRKIALTCKLYKQLMYDARHKDGVTQEDFARLVLYYNYFTFEI